MSGFIWLKRSCRLKQNSPTDKRSVAFLRIFKVGLIVTLAVAGRCLTTSSYGEKTMFCSICNVPGVNTPRKADFKLPK